MASRRVPPNGFYVYILFRRDGVTPFYVGKGGLDRWLMHEARAWRGQTYKDRIILEMQRDGIAVPKIKIAVGLTNAEAGLIEMALIAEIGRLPDGPLVNLTRGGDGVHLTGEALAARNAAIRAAHSRPEVKARWREGMSRVDAAAVAAKRSIKMKGRVRTDEHRAALAANWRSPEKGAAFHAQRIAMTTSPSVRAKRSAGMRAAWMRSEARARMSRAFDPDVRARRDQAVRETAKRPEMREKLSAAGRKGAAARWGKSRE